MWEKMFNCGGNGRVKDLDDISKDDNGKIISYEDLLKQGKFDEADKLVKKMNKITDDAETVIVGELDSLED